MKLKNLLFITLGVICMIIGIVAIFLPILPTTPFLILASVCFSKGSTRFDSWFKNTKIYNDYAKDFINDRSMTLKRKVRIMLLSDFMLAFPLIILENIYVKLLIILLVIIKYYYFIFIIKTKKV